MSSSCEICTSPCWALNVKTVNKNRLVLNNFLMITCIGFVSFWLNKSMILYDK